MRKKLDEASYYILWNPIELYMTATTTICIDPITKDMLSDLRAYKTEPYNSVVARLIKMAYDDELLTDEEIKGIEESLADIKAGRVYSGDEVKKMLGIDD